MAEIQDLTRRVQDLSNKVDFWNNWMLWSLLVVALAGILVLVTTRLVIVRGRQLSNAQEDLNKAKDRQLEVQLKEKDVLISKATDEAAQAKLELARLKEPRAISPEQQQKLILFLKPFAGTNFALAVFPDPEPIALARTIDVLLKSAGWLRVPSQIQQAGGVLLDLDEESAANIFDSGVAAFIAPEDNESIPAELALCSALTTAGIPCVTHRTPQLAGKTPRAITIAIGKKP